MDRYIHNLIAGRVSQFFLAAVTIALSYLLPATAESRQSQWVLKQKSDLVGSITVYVSHDACKVVCPLWGYQLLTKAPDWKVHCFRPQEKIEWVGELEHFNGAMINSPFRSGAPNAASLLPYGTGVMKGLKYTRYAQSRQSLAVLYGADEIPVASGAAEFLSRLSDLPSSGKVPIYRSQIKGAGPDKTLQKDTWRINDAGRDLRTGFVIELMTVSWKKLPYDAADFINPQGFKKINNLDQVAYSTKQKEQLNEVMNGMGFASEQGRSKKQTPSAPSLPAKKRP